MRNRIVVLLCCVLGVSQATITFERTYGFGGNNYGYHLEQTSDGGYILTFEGQDPAHQLVGYLLKTDSLGNQEWVNYYYSPLHRGASPNGLCVTLDKDYVIAGSMGGTGVCDPWAVKADSVGEMLWTYRHDGPNYDYFYSVAPTADSGCILTGKLSEGGSYGQGLLKLTRDGRREWLKFYLLPDQETSGGWVWQTGDHGYYCVGMTRVDTSPSLLNCDWRVVRTDSLGETLWTTTYRPDIPGYIGNNNVSACPTTDGGCVLSGCDAFGHGYMSYVAKLDSLGHGLWARTVFRDTVPGPPAREVYCAQETPDRGFIAVGCQPGGQHARVLVARLDSLCDTLWTRRYDGLDSAVHDNAYWVVNTRDGGYAISGIADERPAYLIKTDSMGVVYVGVSERENNLLTDDVLTAEPNPFRRLVNIRLGPGTGTVFLNGKPCQSPALTVYDASGRLVQRLPSVRNGTWDGRDRNGRLLPAGAYFIEARAGSKRRVVQVLVTR